MRWVKAEPFRKTLWRLYGCLGRCVRRLKINEVRLGRVTIGSRIDNAIRRMLLKGFSATPALLGTRMRLSSIGPDTLEMALGIYEPMTTDFIRTTVSEEMTVVDVGAHVGYYTLLASMGVGRRGRVYAFEPNPKTFDTLLRNLDQNACTNVTALPYAVSNYDGEVSLYVHRSSCMHSLHPQDPTLPAISVRSLRLDSYFASCGWPKIDFIKMDIEGGESAALEGAEATIRRSKPALVVEFWIKHLAAAGVSPQDFLLQLRHLGFSVLAIDESSRRSHLVDGYEDLRRQFGNNLALNLICKMKDV